MSKHRRADITRSPLYINKEPKGSSSTKRDPRGEAGDHRPARLTRGGKVPHMGREEGQAQQSVWILPSSGLSSTNASVPTPGGWDPVRADALMAFIPYRV